MTIRDNSFVGYVCLVFFLNIFKLNNCKQIYTPLSHLDPLLVVRQNHIYFSL